MSDKPFGYGKTVICHDCEEVFVLGVDQHVSMHCVVALKSRLATAERERDALREQVAGLTTALQDAQEFVLTAEYTDRFDNMYWAMADTLTKAIDAALAAIPAPTPAPDPYAINEEAKFRDRERLKAAGVVPIVMPKMATEGGDAS